MTNTMISVSILYTSNSLMACFVLLRTGCICLLECLVMLLTLTLEIKFYQQNCSNKAIGIVSQTLLSFFQNFIKAITALNHILMLDLALF